MLRDAKTISTVNHKAIKASRIAELDSPIAARQGSCKGKDFGQLLRAAGLGGF